MGRSGAGGICVITRLLTKIAGPSRCDYGEAVGRAGLAGLTRKPGLVFGHRQKGGNQMRFPITTCVFAALAVTAAVATTLSASPAAAGDVTKESLVDSLTAVKTRSFDPGRTEREVKFRSFVNTLKAKKTRQITVQERTEVAKFVKENELPSIDLEVYFEYDSAAITPAAQPKLTTLGQALSDERLKGKTFLIAGHTDARGSDAYNQTLSEQRAEAVKQFLATTVGLQAANLVAIGYGEEQLKTPVSPEADENRRVQVVTLGN
jgi:outer membrane protein OmpA-like peptidoglycan-associated protein